MQRDILHYYELNILCIVILKYFQKYKYLYRLPNRNYLRHLNVHQIRYLLITTYFNDIINNNSRFIYISEI